MPDRVRQFSVSWDSEHERFTGLDQFGEQVIDDLWRELSALTADANSARNKPGKISNGLRSMSSLKSKVEVLSAAKR